MNRIQLTDSIVNGIEFAESEFKTFGDEYEIAEDKTISPLGLVKLLEAYAGEISVCQSMEEDLNRTYQKLLKLTQTGKAG